jgi:CDP-glycerol glycerophosphotransferase (TagB/SpsB family)
LGILQSCSEKYQFLIRCHPGQRGQLREIGLWLKDHDISDEFLDLASSSPLPALLAVSDLHITVLSSVVIEAAYFGVPSIILATEDLEYFRKEIDSDWAYPFADDSRLEDLVRHILTKKFVKGNSESSADLPTITCRINSIISVILNDAHDKTGANR